MSKIAKCLCNGPADRYCVHPEPTPRDASKQCGFPLCQNCGEGPDNRLCPPHHYTLRVDVWMGALMAAAMEHGFKGEELAIYQRDRFNDWRGFFRQGISPEEAFGEDLEMSKMLEEFASRDRGDR